MPAVGFMTMIKIYIPDSGTIYFSVCTSKPGRLPGATLFNTQKMDMKIKYFITAAFILSGAAANGQHTTLKTGIHAGASSFNIKNFVGDKYRTGFTAGVYMVQPLSNQFDFQPEINFQQQGSQSTYTTNMGDISNVKYHDRYKLNYLNIPLLLGYRLPKTPLKIYAGPQPGFLLAATLNHHAQDYESARTDIKGNLNKFALSGAYGLSLTFPAGHGNAVVLDGRYAGEFTHLDKGSGPDHGKNYGFTFTIGYLF